MRTHLVQLAVSAIIAAAVLVGGAFFVGASARPAPTQVGGLCQTIVDAISSNVAGGLPVVVPCALLP